jgi:hypothetical protein
MSKCTSQRSRVLKIRTIERRIAEHRLAESSRELKQLSDLATRIAMLRRASGVAAGLHQGMELRAGSEMTHRLDAAHRAMQAPSAAASAKTECHLDMLATARQREAGAEKLADAALRQALRETEARQNASRIARAGNIRDRAST